MVVVKLCQILLSAALVGAAAPQQGHYYVDSEPSGKNVRGGVSDFDFKAPSLSKVEGRNIPKGLRPEGGPSVDVLPDGVPLGSGIREGLERLPKAECGRRGCDVAGGIADGVIGGGRLGLGKRKEVRPGGAGRKLEGNGDPAADDNFGSVSARFQDFKNQAEGKLNEKLAEGSKLALRVSELQDALKEGLSENDGHVDGEMSSGSKAAFVETLDIVEKELRDRFGGVDEIDDLSSLLDSLEAEFQSRFNKTRLDGGRGGVSSRFSRDGNRVGSGIGGISFSRRGDEGPSGDSNPDEGPSGDANPGRLLHSDAGNDEGGGRPRPAFGRPGVAGKPPLGEFAPGGAGRPNVAGLGSRPGINGGSYFAGVNKPAIGDGSGLGGSVFAGVNKPAIGGGSGLGGSVFAGVNKPAIGGGSGLPSIGGGSGLPSIGGGSGLPSIGGGSGLPSIGGGSGLPSIGGGGGLSSIGAAAQLPSDEDDWEDMLERMTSELAGDLHEGAHGLEDRIDEIRNNIGGGVGGSLGGHLGGGDGDGLSFPIRLLKRGNVPIEEVALEFIERNGGVSAEVLMFLEGMSVEDLVVDASDEVKERFEVLKEILRRLLEWLLALLGDETTTMEPTTSCTHSEGNSTTSTTTSMTTGTATTATTTTVSTSTGTTTAPPNSSTTTTTATNSVDPVVSTTGPTAP